MSSRASILLIRPASAMSLCQEGLRLEGLGRPAALLLPLLLLR